MFQSNDRNRPFENCILTENHETSKSTKSVPDNPPPQTTSTNTNSKSIITPQLYRYVLTTVHDDKFSGTLLIQPQPITQQNSTVVLKPNNVSAETASALNIDESRGNSETVACSTKHNIMRYKNPFEYSKYAKTSASKQIKVQSMEDKASSETVWECLLCSKREDNKESLIEHYEYHKKEKGVNENQSTEVGILINLEREKFPCETCGEIYDEAYSLSIHNTSHSEDPHLYTCAVCKNYTCDDKPTLQRHININHKFEEYTRDETIDKSAFCIICKKQFLDKRNLMVHRRLLHSLRPVKYQCQTCKTAMATKKELSRHTCNQETHPILCPVCGKKLKTKKTLKNHIQVHGGDKRYMCQECGKSFFSGSNFKCHMRIHSGERPYECKTCGRCFSQHSPLVIHMRGHTGEKPYVCQTCDRGFTSRSVLNNHSRNCK